MTARQKKAIKKSTNCSAKETCKQIEKKAYELWQKKGCRHSDDWADWFEAKKAVKSE